MLNCPSCGAQNPPAARFCNQCGQRMDAVASPEPAARSYTPRHLVDKVLGSRASMQGERKRVTVLFADVKGSTRLAQEAGPEAWHGILDRFFSILSAAVHRYEGTVNQYTGDGIMALFGAPVAHEDHASRACFAALEMQREVRRFADELRLQKGLNLSMRVGLNTGEVIVGRIGDDLRMDYTAQGATVNLAARMEHICEPGRIYLTRLTARLVEGYFRLRELGPMTVAGVDEPVDVYELEGGGTARTRLDMSLARSGSPFVGREHELGQLLAALERVRGGEGQVLAVIGNAGIGKSRLCHEFANACAASGMPVHRASGVPYRNAVPMHPVRQLARSRLGLVDELRPEELRRLVAGTFLLHDPGHASLLPTIFDFLGVGAGVGEGGGLAPEQAEQARLKLFELLAEHLPCEDRPQLLLVEDLHFLDSASEEFLARLCARVRGSRTLLLLNYRPDYPGDWLIPYLDEQIAVSALSAQQLEQLAQNLLGDDPSVAGLPRVLRERASGNPFFVEEAVLSLSESGHLQGERGDYRLSRPVEQWVVPDTVHALLAARMDRLPDAARSLLQSAAVIGQEFAPPLLAMLAGERDFDDSLGLLEETGFVHQRSETVYAFCHPLMQEVAYQTQLESQRMQIHARLAQDLEAAQPAGAEPAEDSVRIAYHWQCAGEWARAGAWNLQAARWASTRDMRIVLEQFRLALTHLDRAPDSDEVLRQRIAARSGLIRMAQFVDMTRDEVETIYAEARQLVERSGDFASLAELMISYGNEEQHRGNAAAAARQFRDAAQRCIERGEFELLSRFRLGILLTHSSVGWLREGVALLDSMGSEWRTRPIDADNFMSRGFYGLILALQGQLAEAREHLQGALAFAEREDRAASWIHANMVDLAMLTGDYSAALVSAERAAERARSFGSPFFDAIAGRALALALSLVGRREEAIAPLEQVWPLVQPGAFAHQFEARHCAMLSTAYAGVGRHDDALRMARAGIASAQRSGSRAWEMFGWAALLRLPRSMADEVDPASALQKLQDLIAASGVDALKPWLSLARSHWAQTPAEALEWREAAQRGFRDCGADALAQRLERDPGLAPNQLLLC